MPTPDGLLNPAEELQARMFAVDMSSKFTTAIEDLNKNAETILAFLKGIQKNAE